MEVFDSGFDRRQIGQIHRQKVEVAFRVRMLGGDLIDGCFRLGLAATCDVDGGIVLIKDGAELCTDAGVPAGDDENLNN